MNVLIAGCSRLGQSLADQLLRLGHDISIVDDDPQKIQALNENAEGEFDGVLTVCGVPIDTDILRSAGIENCDAVAAVTSDNNINIMVAEMAREVFGVKNVITSISDPMRKQVFAQHFGMHAVCSTSLTVQNIVAALMQEDINEKQTVMFGSSTATFFTEPAADKHVGHSVRDIRAPRADMMIYGVVHEDNRLELSIGNGPVVQAGDTLIYCVVAD